MALGNLAIRPADSGEETNSYDNVPYESYCYPVTHPERLYTVAKLFGLNPPDFRKARVLELGCAAGGNLIPMAVMYPEGEYTGIDLSGEQIGRAIHQKDKMKLSNIQFHCMDIMDITKKFGAYDYIVVHGILSWVPQDVANKILDVCRDNLTENGLAVVSYNTLPGWNFVKSLREMMLYHCSRFSDPKAVVNQARLFLDFLSENTGSNTVYKQFIDSERGMLSKVNDTYLFHDHLEAHNRQYYFHEIIKMTGERGLGYVGDASLTSMFIGNMPKGAMEKLKDVSDIVQQEQYMDFITNRRFRTTILCHASQKPNRSLPGSRIFDFYLSGSFKPAEDGAELEERMNFVTKQGNRGFQTHSKVTGALMLATSDMPARYRMADLVAAASKKYGLDEDEVRKAAEGSGLPLVMSGLLGIHSGDALHAVNVSKKPKAFEVARYQASLPGTTKLTNAAGDTIQTDVFNNHIIRYLDGKNDLKAIEGKLVAHAMSRDIEVRKDGKLISDEGRLREILSPVIGARLEVYAGSGILMK